MSARPHAHPRPRAGESLISQLLLNRIKPNFQDILGPTQGQSWWEKNLPPLSQKPIFLAKKGGVKPPKITPKTQPTRIWLKFSGLAKTNK